VVGDPGVSRYHVRVARSVQGAFYAEDLGSTNGTYVRSIPVGVALLHAGDVLQLGPYVRVRFAMLDREVMSSSSSPPERSGPRLDSSPSAYGGQWRASK
jgi:pSer/pThr/pTyr-binding forkhead associated (FHA) protein